MSSYPVPLSPKKDRCMGQYCLVAPQCAKWQGHEWQTFGGATKIVARLCDTKDVITPIKYAEG